MQTTKFVFVIAISLAILFFTTDQSLNAATSASEVKRSFTSTKHIVTPISLSDRSRKVIRGLASIYADKFNGRKTASGQKFSQKRLTAAHRSLPFGTKVRVINIRNHKSVEVRINDRGPLPAGRVIDVSAAAAAKIGMEDAGIQLVRLEIIAEKPAGES